MKRVIPPTKTLTDRQKYLLQRIPNKWDLNGYHAEKEPIEVSRARKLVARYDKAESRRQCAAAKRNEALLRKAKEAVYFHSETKALAIVQQVEKLLKACD
jgi:hypothetical protein